MLEPEIASPVRPFVYKYASIDYPMMAGPHDYPILASFAFHNSRDDTILISFKNQSPVQNGLYLNMDSHVHFKLCLSHDDEEFGEVEWKLPLPISNIKHFHVQKTNFDNVKIYFTSKGMTYVMVVEPDGTIIVERLLKFFVRYPLNYRPADHEENQPNKRARV